MKAATSKKRKKFGKLKIGEVFEHEAAVYLKTEEVGWDGTPACFQIGTGERLFLSHVQAAELLVTPVGLVRG